MQLICKDEQHFPDIRAKNGVYVDKTRIMYDLFKDGKYFFISRPRRFGKSLLCSTVAALFAGKKDLFKGLWIEKSDWEWQAHPVIHLDMTKASSPTNLAQNVIDSVLLLLKVVAEQNGISGITASSYESYFSELIRLLYEKTWQRVVVIIDEYDKPLLDVVDHKERYQAIQEVLRGLYGQLKAASEHLRFVFLTGVFKFAKTSVFSGLNNLNDLTFNPRACELLGYTEQELKDYFPEHLKNLSAGYKKTEAEMLEELAEQYNGYAFGVDDKQGAVVGSVYNPFAMNYVFSEQQLLKKWFVSATPTFLLQKLKQQSFSGIDHSELVVDFGLLQDSCSPDNIQALMLLYYAGYVTLKAYNSRQEKVTLDYPNAEVAQALSKSLLAEITQKPLTSFGILTSNINDALYDERLSEFKDIFNQGLAQVPYHLFGTHESYYQSMLFMLLNASSVVTVAEDMTNRGRADITVLLSKTVYIFELKVNQPTDVALQQIKARNYAEKYRHLGRKIYAVGITLSSSDRIIEALAYEDITVPNKI